MRTNRFINSLVALIVTAMVVFVSCHDEDESTFTTISLDEDVISLVKGTSQRLIPTIEPPAATSAIIWSSSNTEVATVNGDGVVQSIGEGKAIINAKIGNSTAFCDVIVTDQPVPVRGIILNKINLEMRVGDVEELEAEFIPNEATNRRKRWSSSDENIVSVHEINGILTAKAYGEVVITVTTMDGDYTATCIVTVLPVIELFSPSEENIRLHPAEIGKKVTFTWNNIEGIDRYILKVSTTDRFSESDIIYTATATENKLDVPEYDLNEAIREVPGNLVALYWTIESGTTGIRVLPATGKLNLEPDRSEFLLLAQGSATGMKLQKMEDAYHYSITTNGQASVNTVTLKNNVHADSSVVSIMYKSNRELASATIRFISSGGAIRGTAQKAIPQSTEWSEWRLPQMELPSGWGNAGDYLMLDLGDETGYQIELNAIRLSGIRPAEYIPEIILIQSFNNQVSDVVLEDNYYKFTVTGGDSNGSTLPFTRKLPAGAVIFSFEYKSNMTLANNLQIFFGPALSEGRSLRAGTVPANPTDEWKEHRVDMSALRTNFPTWGVPGDNLRIDFGETPSIGMTMEIRNIQFKFKD